MVIPPGTITLTWYRPGNPAVSPLYITVAGWPPIVIVTGFTVADPTEAVPAVMLESLTAHQISTLLQHRGNLGYKSSCGYRPPGPLPDSVANMRHCYRIGAGEIRRHLSVLSPRTHQVAAPVRHLHFELGTLPYRRGKVRVAEDVRRAGARNRLNDSGG